MDRNNEYDYFWLCYGEKGHTRVFQGEKRPSAVWMEQNRIAKIRAIEAPQEDLKAEQTAVTKSLFDLGMGPSPFAHAYVFGRSIVSNAQPHVGKAFMVKLDIKECYDHVHPDIVLPRIKAMFGKAGKEWTAAVEAELLHTLFLRTRRLKTDDGAPRWHLPTGAPSSPFLLNIALWNFDWRMHRFLTKWKTTSHATRANKPVVAAAADEALATITVITQAVRALNTVPVLSEVVYTRYSDNITISSDDARIVQLIPVVRYFLGKEGLFIHPKKTQFLTPAHPHRVCGVMTNTKITAGKRRYRRLRSALHRYTRDIHAGTVPAWNLKTKDGKTIAIDMHKLRGEVEFVAFCDAVQGARLRSSFFRLQDICQQKTTQTSDVSKST